MNLGKRPTLEFKNLCSFSIGDQAENKHGGPSKGAKPVGLNEPIRDGGIIALLLKKGMAGHGVEEGDGPSDEHGQCGCVGPS